MKGARINIIQREMEMRVMILVTSILLAAVSVASADKRMNSRGGECPLGTYAKGGGTYANNIANCSASNKPFAARFQNSNKHK